MPQEIALVLTLAGSDVLDRFGSFRGGERKRRAQPTPSEETSPWLEMKTRRTAGEPELTLAMPSNTAHPLRKRGYGWANRVLQLCRARNPQHHKKGS